MEADVGSFGHVVCGGFTRLGVQGVQMFLGPQDLRVMQASAWQ